MSRRASVPAEESAPSLLRQLGPVLLLLIAMAACARVQIGERNEPPSWRRPGPAVMQPQPGQRVPDDGFRDYLAGVAPLPRV